MKQLSIEQKAKRYDEALEMAKKLIENEETNVPVFYVNNIKDIFPELKESDGEKIRKAILELVKQSSEILEKKNQEQMIAWLEKQGEQKPAWSEEDENLFRCAIDAVKQESKVRTDGCLDEEVGGMVIDWLKSLKERVQPKQEWSEEDEVKINRIVACLENLNVADNDILLKDINWLKSLRPQNRWKPSDLPHWKKSTLPNDNTTGFNSDYFCYKGYNINYKELFEKLPKDD